MPMAEATALGTEAGSANGAKLDQPDSVVELVENVEGHLEGKPCLPDATRAHHRDQTGCAEQPGKRCTVLGPSYEAGTSERQVVGQDSNGAQRWEIVPEVGVP